MHARPGLHVARHSYRLLSSRRAVTVTARSLGGPEAPAAFTVPVSVLRQVKGRLCEDGVVALQVGR